MLLKACGYDNTSIDNIRYPGKASYQYEHNTQRKFTIYPGHASSSDSRISRKVQPLAEDYEREKKK